MTSNAGVQERIRVGGAVGILLGFILRRPELLI